MIQLFIFNDTSTAEIYTLSLHDALPICAPLMVGALCEDCRLHLREVEGHLEALGVAFEPAPRLVRGLDYYTRTTDRKSTRLNSSHANISYAVFCLKKKKVDVCIHMNAMK